MDRLWKKIKEDVSSKNWDTNGLRDLVSNPQLDVVLVKHGLFQDSLIPGNFHGGFGCAISRTGDILVGFYLDANAEQQNLKLQLTIGGTSIPDLLINKGEFAYIFENTHILPMVALQYSVPRVTTSDFNGLYAIYALIRDTNVRRKLGSSTNILRFSPEKNALVRGHFGYVDANVDNFLRCHTDWNDSYVEIPNMTDLDLKRCNDCQENIDEEKKMPTKKRKLSF